MHNFYEKFQELLLSNRPFISVVIVDAIGSVPQEIGAKMLVTSEGLYQGTVGGGKIEKRAVEEAKAMLSESLSDPMPPNRVQTRFVQWSLDRDIGMTCGGSVKLYFEAFNIRSWNITVFGAGHCANALIQLLIKLDCAVTCFDHREEWLARLPDSPRLKRVAAQDLPAKVPEIPADSFVVLMTMGHSTDKPVLMTILKDWTTRQFPYLGVIGSKAKAARLHKDVIEAGLPAEYKNLFFCPVGLPLGANTPEEIAISVAAQLLQVRDKLRTAEDNSSD